MTYDNLRLGRYSQPYQAYSITTVTHQRTPFFTDLYCARRVIREMRRLHEAGEVQSQAWVLMPDHLHWLIELTATAPLAQIMHTFKGRSAQQVNQYLGRRGPVWQRAYYDHALRQEEDLKTVARYIVANPLRAGLAETIGDYPLWDAAWM